MLNVNDISITYSGVPTVEGVSFTMQHSEIVAIVGESGSGKSTVLRAILGCLPNGGALSRGDILFEGASLPALSREAWRGVRGTEISAIFQDSGAMINPIRKIGSQYVEYIRAHSAMKKADAWLRGVEMLERMRLPDGNNIMKSYPFQLSGGMRQRVGIAMAMTFEPKLLLADEPTSALDVTTQAQIVREMMGLREQFGTAILVVTHNLGVAAYMADRILVMKDGRIVDEGDRDHILHHATSDYTRKLIAAVPSMGGLRYV
jgi:peptide/nickel transport system ATP-binding protein